MLNVFSPLIKAWYDLLSGQITIEGNESPVFTIQPPALNVPDTYTLIRPESETNEGNKHAFMKNPVIVVEHVSKFKNVINYTVVDQMDDQANALLYNSPSSNNLNVQGFQLIGVDGGSATYLEEDDGTNKYWRKVTRYIHQTIQ